MLGVFLTHIKLKALVLKAVSAASGLIVLLQDYNPFPGFGQKCSCCQPSDAATDHHSIQTRGDTVHPKPCREEHTLSDYISVDWDSDLRKKEQHI